MTAAQEDPLAFETTDRVTDGVTSRAEVVVVGGGPSGATCAHVLAEAGVDVVVVEREAFPRFHIGESLLPIDLRALERLGLSLGDDEALRKSGADFYAEHTGDSTTYPFAGALDGTPEHAYQVERAVFDKRVLDGAVAKGAKLVRGIVADVRTGSDGVRVELESSERISARYLVDATGLDALLARRGGTLRMFKSFGLAAVFTHWGGLRPEVQASLYETGNIHVLFLPEQEGWLWAIPLVGGRLSVGLVSRKTGIRVSHLEERIATSPKLSWMLDGAHRTRDPGARTSFSFVNDRPAGARFACIGDAACFLDPVFSSGVSLGMCSAVHFADMLLPALRASDEARPDLMAAHVEHMLTGYQVFGSLVNGYYQSNLLLSLFFSREQDPVIRRGVTSVLAGDVWRDDNAFVAMLERSERRRWTELRPS